MKKVILVLVVMGLTSCSKDGVMYKFCSKADKNQPYTTTNFFIRDHRDDKAALEWYKTTEAWDVIKSNCDTCWVEYWGKVKDWK